VIIQNPKHNGNIAINRSVTNLICIKFLMMIKDSVNKIIAAPRGIKAE